MQSTESTRPAPSVAPPSTRAAATPAAAALSASSNIDALNQRFRHAQPMEILEYFIDNSVNAVLSTNFRPLSAAILHMATRIKPDIPVVWIDSGYNTPATYRFAQNLISTLALNIRTYTPTVTAARRESLYGGVPDLDAVDEHQQFTREVKLQPFQTAFAELRPDVWITAIRRDQTEFRKSLDIASTAMSGILRIAPYFYWNDAAIENYIRENNLPDNNDYADPTKVVSGRECGLQTLTV